MTLASYVFGLVLSRIAAALAVLFGVLQILDMLDVTTEILDRGLGGAGLAYYALLRSPRLLEQAAPVAVLAGALLAFTKLANESEVTAMRSTGLSAYRLTAMALPAAVIFAVAQLAMTLMVAPQSDAVLSAWWRATAPPVEAAAPKSMSFRVEDEIVVAQSAGEDGARLSNVIIYRRDAGGRLVSRTSAEAAVYEAQNWRLIAPSFMAVTPDGVQSGSAAQMTWTGALRPADVRSLFYGEAVITPQEARRAVAGGPSVRSAAYYDTQLQRTWAAPMACLVMLLLTAPAALGDLRSGRGVSLVVGCLAAGLVFLVFDGAITALGESGVAPAWLAAWSAPLMFAALGLTALLHLEG